MAETSANKRKADSDDLLLAPMPSPSKDSHSVPADSAASDSPATQTEGNQQFIDPSVDKDRSGVWVHFKKQKNSSGEFTGRAICVWCGKDYQAKSSLGTSALWKHLRLTCKKFPHKSELLTAHNKSDKS